MVFDNINKAPTTKALAFFNPKLETELVVDAGPVCLGAILDQVGVDNTKMRHILAYGSRTLSKLERKYAQVEKEALACIFVCERFYIYLVGHTFKLITDNKAIQFIYGGSKGRSQARIERWDLRLSPYDFQIEHRPGKDNPADILSRNPDSTGLLNRMVIILIC